jgi:hypothetical protein
MICKNILTISHFHYKIFNEKKIRIQDCFKKQKRGKISVLSLAQIELEVNKSFFRFFDNNKK